MYSGKKNPGGILLRKYFTEINILYDTGTLQFTKSQSIVQVKRKLHHIFLMRVEYATI